MSLGSAPRERYVCIHGHFYQPPRENPWLEAIEIQDSAYPYHDWNERVTAECYAPNAASRILDEKERIADIGNNYSRISFDFGPTLLSWLEAKAPDVYAAVLAADRESAALFSGHGSAMAQAYSHPILPLATRRDKRTQVLWGLRDFRRRFGRDSEGMWLPETAVDLETLEVLAECGVRFTILAPHQAAREREVGADWHEVPSGGIESGRAYRAPLPSGRSIDVFFYDGPIARDVAFGGLLHSGQRFESRLLSRFSPGGTEPQLTNVATDGETYGHHHAHGDMALAYALAAIAAKDEIGLTNYGEFLSRHPPAREVEVHERTSWSCSHGVERWRSDCGCATGAHPGWTQAWRAPLREAFDGLRDAIEARFEERASRLLTDPWAARDAYVDVVLDRSAESVEAFFDVHAARDLSADERRTALKLLEMQRHALLMYTSCGWFFDDLAGIETVQVLQYAGRAAELAQDLFDTGDEERLAAALAEARSNRAEAGNGKRVYETQVIPAKVDLLKLAGHYAVRSLFDSYEPRTRVYCYEVEREEFREAAAGAMKLAIGRARFTSETTGEARRLAFGALHLGDHNVHGSVGLPSSDDAHEVFATAVFHAFSLGEVPEVLRLLDAGLGERVVSLKLLFRDERRRILKIILESARADAEAVLRGVYERYLPLMRFLTELGSPAPRVFRATSEAVVHSTLRRALEAPVLDGDAIAALLEEAARERLSLDAEGFEYALRKRIEEIAAAFARHPEDLALSRTLRSAVELARRFPFPVRLWKIQNVYWDVLRRLHPDVAERASSGDEAAREWIADFEALGALLSVRLPSSR